MLLPSHIVACAGIIENSEGKILLVNTYDYGWVFPGGIIENGETLSDGLLREIREETSVAVEIKRLFCVSSNVCEYKGYNGVEKVPTKVMLDFVCRYVSGEARPSNENSASEWFSIDEARELIQAPAQKQRFRAYLENSSRIKYLAYRTNPEFILVEENYI